MTVEMIESRKSSYLETLANVASRSGPKMSEAIKEFLQAVEDGKVIIFFKEAAVTPRVDRRWQEPGIAHLFLPPKYSSDQAEKGVVSVLADTLIVTRRLSGPEVHTMRQFKKELREEREELVMSPQL